VSKRRHGRRRTTLPGGSRGGGPLRDHPMQAATLLSCAKRVAAVGRRLFPVILSEAACRADSSRRSFSEGGSLAGRICSRPSEKRGPSEPLPWRGGRGAEAPRVRGSSGPAPRANFRGSPCPCPRRLPP
jgi:hypothetical protein